MYRLYHSTPKDLTRSDDFNRMWPLPIGEYPIFNKFPKYIVDFQQIERERISEENRHMEKQRLSVEMLQQRIEKLQIEEQQWKIKQENV